MGGTRVGVIGLGNIGAAIAANLVADGHEVTVHDTDAARARALAGATPVASASAVGVRSEVNVHVGADGAEVTPKAPQVELITSGK